MRSTWTSPAPSGSARADKPDVVFRPADVDDLAHFLSTRPADLPVTVVGLGSNLLVRDGGVAGVVVRLRQGFRDLHVRWDGPRALVEIGAGALDMNVARQCRDQGVGGLSFLSGIPGTIGGALRMNAGAYGHEMANVVVEARALDGSGGLHVLAPDAMGLSYRHSAVPDDWIFVSAVLEGRREEPAAIARRMEEINAQREASQPIRARTGGSTFTNPAGRSAWELIDEAECRGLARGGARISEQHCNFIVNADGRQRLGHRGARRGGSPPGRGQDRPLAQVGNPQDRAPPALAGGQRGGRGMSAERTHVAVLKGGWSAEREVSLVSGAAVEHALAEGGYRVSGIDVTRDLATLLAETGPDVVFNALHGSIGEDGCVQGLLEVMGLPYTHSGVRASAMAMDKPVAKRLFADVGLICPEGRVMCRAEIAAGAARCAALRDQAARPGL